MTVRSQTLQQLIDGVADAADLNIAASGVRHTNAKVTTRINRALQRWFIMAAEAGDDTRLVSLRTATATSTTRDAANWAPNMYVALPTGCMLLRGIDVWSGTTPFAMLSIDEIERNDHRDYYNWQSGTGIGFPVFYRMGGINAAAANIVQIFPWADAVYTVDIRYIPAITDLSGLSDTADFICGGEEWVINDAAIQSLRNDGLSSTAETGELAARNRKLEEDLKFTLSCRSTIRKVDTREMRRRLRAFANTRPWGT